MLRKKGSKWVYLGVYSPILLALTPVCGVPPKLSCGVLGIGVLAVPKGVPKVCGVENPEKSHFTKGLFSRFCNI